MRWPFDMLARFQGRLEGIGDGRLHGWAVDRRALNVRQTVWLTDPHGHRVDVVADLYRADLNKSGIGDGHYGFSVPVGHLAGAEFVRATIAGSERPLAGSPYAFTSAPSGRRSVRGGMLVQVDAAVDRRVLTGWVIDLADTPRRPALALRQRDQVVAHDRATRLRNDIDLPGCDALHGFRLTWSGSRPGPCDLINTRDGRLLATVRAGF